VQRVRRVSSLENRCIFVGRQSGGRGSSGALGGAGRRKGRPRALVGVGGVAAGAWPACHRRKGRSGAIAAKEWAPKAWPRAGRSEQVPQWHQSRPPPAQTSIQLRPAHLSGVRIAPALTRPRPVGGAERCSSRSMPLDSCGARAAGCIGPGEAPSLPASMLVGRPAAFFLWPERWPLAWVVHSRRSCLFGPPGPALLPSSGGAGLEDLMCRR